MAGFLYNNLQLVAGQRYALACSGRYAYFESGSGVARFQLGNEGRTQADLFAGMGAESERPFDVVYIESPASQTVDVYISDTPPIDNRTVITGSIDASPYNLTANSDTYVGGQCFGEQAANNDANWIYLENDTAENKYVTAAKIVFHQHSTAGDGVCLVVIANARGSTQSGATVLSEGMRDKVNSRDDASAWGEFSAGYGAALTANYDTIARYQMTANVDKGEVNLFSETEPLLLLPGEYLAVSSGVGGPMSINLEAKPSAAAQSAAPGFAYSGTGLNYLTMPTFAESAASADKVVRAALRATSADEAGISNATQYSATMDITTEGIDPNGVRGLTYDISASDAALQAGGRMSVTLDENFNIEGYDPASTRYLASVQHFNLQFKGNQRFRFQLGSAIPESSTEDIFIGGAGKPSEWAVDVNWNGFDIELFFDGLPVLAHTFTGWGATFASNMYGAGLTSIANDYEGNRIKDLMLLSEPHTFIDASESVMFLGDSLTTQGSPPAFMTAPQAGWASPDWLPTNNQGGFAGFSGVDNSNSSPSFTTDEGLVCSVMRALFKAGIRPTNNTNFARTGDDVAQQLGQVNRLTGGQSPTFAVCQLGTNNASDNHPASRFVSEYQSLITELEGEGIARLIICTVPSLEASAGGAVDRSGQTYIDAVDSYNAEIDGLITWSIAQGYAIQIHKADTFAALGGHSINLADFKASDLHPAEPGSQKIGATIGAAMVAALTA